MFFIQACQGDNLDRGVTLSRTEHDGHPGSYRIPIHADFLIAYSTIPGRTTILLIYFIFNHYWFFVLFEKKINLLIFCVYVGFYSWRNTTRGSWFIQALCEELQESQYKADLMTLLTFVNQRVALDYESNCPDSTLMHRQKQIPCITSMLTRLILFSPK